MTTARPANVDGHDEWAAPRADEEIFEPPFDTPPSLWDSPYGLPPQTLDTLTADLAAAQAQHRFSDAKAAGLPTVAAVLLGVLLGVPDLAVPVTWADRAVWGSVAALAAATVLAVWVIWPRLGRPGGRTGYARLADLTTEDEVVADAADRSRDRSAAAGALARDVMAAARLAHRKHRQVRLVAAAAVVCPLLAMASLVLTGLGW